MKKENHFFVWEKGNETHFGGINAICCMFISCHATRNEPKKRTRGVRLRISAPLLTPPRALLRLTPRVLLTLLLFVLFPPGREAPAGIEASAPGRCGLRASPFPQGSLCEHNTTQYKNHRLNNGDFLLWESIIIRFVCHKASQLPITPNQGV